MSPMSSCTIRVVRWPDARHTLASVREAVFVREQGVPAELEWDGLDDTCIHALAADECGNAIGTARMLPDGHIGRMAVLQGWRGRGVGSELLEVMLDQARAAGFETVRLNAQTHVVAFYRRFGFRAIGAEFMDAGIPHVTMMLALGKDQGNGACEPPSMANA